MAEWKDLGNKAKNLTLAGLGKARDLGESAKLNLNNVSEEENKKRIYVEIAKRFVEENPTPPEGYVELYAQLREVESRIEANNARLNQLKDEGVSKNDYPALLRFYLDTIYPEHQASLSGSNFETIDAKTYDVR